MKIAISKPVLSFAAAMIVFSSGCQQTYKPAKWEDVRQELPGDLNQENSSELQLDRFGELTPWGNNAEMTISESNFHRSGRVAAGGNETTLPGRASGGVSGTTLPTRGGRNAEAKFRSDFETTLPQREMRNRSGLETGTTLPMRGRILGNPDQPTKIQPDLRQNSGNGTTLPKRK